MIGSSRLRAVRARALRTLRPRTRWGRITLWSGGLSLLLAAIRRITHSPPDCALSGWVTFFGLLFAFCAFWLSVRWAWRESLWRLRHRLIVTYVFIGVVPLLLLLLLVSLGSYLFAGQLAAYIAISDLQSALQHLSASNDALATEVRTMRSNGKLDNAKLNKQLAGERFTATVEDSPQRTVTVWQGREGFVLSSGEAQLKAHPVPLPAAVQGNFSGVVIDGDTLYLRAVHHVDGGSSPLTVISSVPVTPELLQPASSRLGVLTLLLPNGSGNLGERSQDNLPIVQNRVQTGRVPPPSRRFDPTFAFYTLFSAIDWETARSRDCAIGVITRPSMLYHTLFATLGDKTRILQQGLLAIAILLGLVELAALFIGIRLTRSMTRSVAELYSATVHVNRGDFSHRIRIRGRDQMAVLEQSFNSMSESLVKLLAEQKQKQRLESELSFAHEVQDLLFPHNFKEITSLDVYGACCPARTVSGDYYDFIPLGRDGLLLAVGDISGKGVSAALLMATLHAFVRAYSMEPELVSAAAGRGLGTDPGPRFLQPTMTAARPSPAVLMTTLNYQLFRSTPPEKYATMFLGFYDASTRELTYCNAGHLPPMVLRRSGAVARLDTSGTVVGLFDDAVYEESTISMQAGDLFVAFTDGVTEPENESVEFGEERLIATIQKHREEPLSRISAVVTDAVVAWIGGAEQPDDVTVVLARAL